MTDSTNTLAVADWVRVANDPHTQGQILELKNGLAHIANDLDSREYPANVVIVDSRLLTPLGTV